jgi:hypothetical protein
MKKTNLPGKLDIKTETLLPLQPATLDAVQGGAAPGGGEAAQGGAKGGGRSGINPSCWTAGIGCTACC